MNFINQIRTLWAPPTALAQAARELDEHKRQLLNAQSSAEYAQGMVAYHCAAIDRLSNYLKEEQ
jgi:prephenate dehydratase